MAALAVAALAVAVAAVIALMWPSGSQPLGGGAIDAGEPAQATVQSVARLRCEQSRRPCQRLELELETGPDAGETTQLTLPGEDVAPQVSAGDRIRVVRNFDPEQGGARPGQGAAEPYAFADFERRTAVYLVVALFALFVVALGRWQGLRSLAGLALSLLFVTQFMVPAILEGTAALPVALAGSLAVMLVTVALTHGLGAKSVAAILGAVASLALTAILALLFVQLGQITGFSSDEASLLRATPNRSQLSLEGLVLAGMVVGALGVLDDVTVSQASTVIALRRANPAQRFRALFRRAMTVGRDHLSATVNTLVLAYVGASLPILLIFADQQTSFATALNREDVAETVIALCVGSIGLVTAVPLTTALAAMLTLALPITALGNDTDTSHPH